MDYMVTSGVAPPRGSAGLDALHQEGVSALLERQLGRVEGVTGPAGTEIDLLDYGVTVHDQGASVVVVLDAPSLQAAEEAASGVLGELLSESEVFADWSVTSSEVRITEDDFNQRLAEAERFELDGQALDPGALEDSDLTEDTATALDTGRWREKLLEVAGRLRAFGPESFGAGADGSVPLEQSQIAAGALIHAVRVVTDELFYDEMALAAGGETVDDVPGLLVLDELPPRYAHRYDVVFARSFLVTSVAIGTRLTATEWVGPSCVAESLALRLFTTEARVILEAAGLLSWENSGPLFEAFVATAFADQHELLYQPDTSAEVESALTARGLAFHQWFDTFGSASQRQRAAGTHPYLDAEYPQEETGFEDGAADADRSDGGDGEGTGRRSGDNAAGGNHGGTDGGEIPRD